MHRTSRICCCNYFGNHLNYLLNKELPLLRTQKPNNGAYARPVYLQKEDTITGHFLICYLAVLLTRLLQFKVLKNEYCSEELFDFIHDFRVAKISDRKYVNLTSTTSFIKEFASLTGLPLISYFLSDGEIKKVLSHRF